MEDIHISVEYTGLDSFCVFVSSPKCVFKNTNFPLYTLSMHKLGFWHIRSNYYITVKSNAPVCDVFLSALAEARWQADLPEARRHRSDPVPSDDGRLCGRSWRRRQADLRPVVNASAERTRTRAHKRHLV